MEDWGLRSRQSFKSLRGFAPLLSSHKSGAGCYKVGNRLLGFQIEGPAIGREGAPLTNVFGSNVGLTVKPIEFDCKTGRWVWKVCGNTIEICHMVSTRSGCQTTPRSGGCGSLKSSLHTPALGVWRAFAVFISPCLMSVIMLKSMASLLHTNHESEALLKPQSFQLLSQYMVRTLYWSPLSCDYHYGSEVCSLCF